MEGLALVAAAAPLSLLRRCGCAVVSLEVVRSCSPLSLLQQLPSASIPRVDGVGAMARPRRRERRRRRCHCRPTQKSSQTRPWLSLQACTSKSHATSSLCHVVVLSQMRGHQQRVRQPTSIFFPPDEMVRSELSFDVHFNHTTACTTQQVWSFSASAASTAAAVRNPRLNKHQTACTSQVEKRTREIPIISPRQLTKHCVSDQKQTRPSNQRRQLSETWSEHTTYGEREQQTNA